MSQLNSITLYSSPYQPTSDWATPLQPLMGTPILAPGHSICIKTCFLYLLSHAILVSFVVHDSILSLRIIDVHLRTTMSSVQRRLDDLARYQIPQLSTITNESAHADALQGIKDDFGLVTRDIEVRLFALRGARGAQGCHDRKWN